MYKYYFHIIDNCFNEEYDFEGFFLDHDEAAEFIENHEKHGNVVTIVAPGYELVPISECPVIYANAIRKALANC